MREQVIQKTLEKKIVAIVRGVYGEDCVKLAEALHRGGIGLMEVTFDHSKPTEFATTTDTVRLVAQRMDGRMLLGAGTVTSLETLELAHGAGARFIVSPDTNPKVIRRTVELGMVSMPGALTPTEILLAHDSGADFVKVFPSGVLGVDYIKSVRGPFNHIRLLAVGGVNEKNAADFMAAGCTGLGIGGNLVSKDWIKAGRWQDIEALAAEYVKAVRG
jgi:2-dehydro-3-deoxyphosphogluconate aldolase/(4S)-4-hydroxy-2-oxoglutarate aldolase